MAQGQSLARGIAQEPCVLPISGARSEERANDGSDILIQVDPTAREDVLTLISWSNGATLEQALHSARPCLARKNRAQGGTTVIEVWYSGQRLVSCQVQPGAPQRMELARHSGVHLCLGSFRLRIAPDSPTPNLRALLLLSVRARTPLEDGSAAWLPPLDAASELQPGATELLSLRRALFG